MSSTGAPPQTSAYTYPVSEAAAITFCVLFGLSCLVAVYQLFKKRAWIWIVMVLAVAGESAGYAVRVVSAQNLTSRTLYAASFTMIVLPPVLMAGIIYVVFGRIVFLVVPPRDRTFRMLWAPARWLTPIFVAFDILSLLLQLIGALMLTSADPESEGFTDQIDRGRLIAVVGVVVQIVAFGFFTIVAGRFHAISKRFDDRRHEPLSDSHQSMSASEKKPGLSVHMNWRHLLLAIIVSCGLILIRSVYRLVEFIEGREGYIMNNEWPLYVLDAAPMLAVCIIFNIVDPGDFVHMGFRQKSRRGQDEETEMQ